MDTSGFGFYTTFTIVLCRGSGWEPRHCIPRRSNSLRSSCTHAYTTGNDITPRVLRAVILRSIDQLWVEHLTEVDDLRRGIGLRGYAQEDPLNAFKKEAFKLYDEFQGLIRVSIGRSILRVSVVQQEAPRPKIVATSSASTTSAPAPKAPVVAAAGVGRNDPCPCGSGKKYKKCHGA